MKKLIAFTVALVVCSHAAFAEITFSGNLRATWGFLGGYSEAQVPTRPNDKENPDNVNRLDMPWTWIGGSNSTGNVAMGRARLQVNAVNDEGTLGGGFRIQATPANIEGQNFQVWWQPIPIFRATLGDRGAAVGTPFDIVFIDDYTLPVRRFGRGNLNYWGSGARVNDEHDFGHGNGAHLELINPIENLYAIVTVPYGFGAWGRSNSELNAGEVFAQTAVRVAYTLPNIGIAALTWDGGMMRIDESNGKDDAAYISVSFQLTMVENLDAFLGFDIPLPSRGGRWNQESHKDHTIWQPLSLDIRARYNFADMLGVPFRIAGGIGMGFAGYDENKVGGKTTKRNAPVRFGLTLNPEYDLGIVVVGLLGEMGITGATDKDGWNLYASGQNPRAGLGHPIYTNEQDPTLNATHHDTFVNVNILPYVRKDIGGGSVSLGFNFQIVHLQDKVTNKGMQEWKYGLNWAIPIAFVYNF